MRVRELIEQLSQFDPEAEVAILDGFNATGQNRQINCGPRLFDPNEVFACKEQRDYSDLETAKEGEPIVQLGFGHY